MDLDPHIESLREQLALAAEAGGEDTRALAQRLTASLDSAVRLMLLDALSAAAGEITRELAPGSVELRLRGGTPEFVVTAAPGDHQPPGGSAHDEAARAEGWAAGHPGTSLSTGEGGVARVNLRLPDQLKRSIEQAADREGLSLNAWLVRAAAGAIDRSEAGGRPESRGPRGAQRYSGWGH